MTDSQVRVKNLKGGLKRVKDSLEQRRSDLLQLWFQSQQYKEMLSILDTMSVPLRFFLTQRSVFPGRCFLKDFDISHHLCTREELRITPEKLETLLNDKHFLTATNVLSKAIKTLNEKEMMQIGALEDIQRGLTSQKTVSITRNLAWDGWMRND